MAKMLRPRVILMEEIVHRVQLEKQVVSKAVRLVLQPVRDRLGTQKQEVISHLQQINQISTNGIN